MFNIAVVQARGRNSVFERRCLSPTASLKEPLLLDLKRMPLCGVYPNCFVFSRVADNCLGLKNGYIVQSSSFWFRFVPHR